MNDIIEAHLSYLTAAGYAADTTVRDRGQLLYRLDRDLPAGLDQASDEELLDWFATSGGSGRLWGAKTRATYSEHVRGFYAWATDPRDPWLTLNPAAGLPIPKTRRGLPRPVTPDDLSRALRELPHPWRLYVALAGLAGLRCCEIATVQRDNITEIDITVRGKGGKVRSIPTHPLIWSGVQGKPSGHVVHLVRGRPANATYISNLGRAKLREVGVMASMHQLRHRFGTDINRSANTRVAQELLGHESLATTAIYTLVTDEEKRRAVFALRAPSEWAAA